MSKQFQPITINANTASTSSAERIGKRNFESRRSLRIFHSLPHFFLYRKFSVVCIQRSVIHLISWAKDAKGDRVSVDASARGQTPKHWIFDNWKRALSEESNGIRSAKRLSENTTLITGPKLSQQDPERQRVIEYILIDYPSVIMSVKESSITNVALPLFFSLFCAETRSQKISINLSPLSACAEERSEEWKESLRRRKNQTVKIVKVFAFCSARRLLYSSLIKE